MSGKVPFFTRLSLDVARKSEPIQNVSKFCLELISQVMVDIWVSGAAAGTLARLFQEDDFSSK